jgi:hypothetical protein
MSGQRRVQSNASLQLPALASDRLPIYASCQPPNKQLQRTVTRRRGRAARAPFHYARASRWTSGRAAAELRRYAQTRASGDVPSC